MSSPLDLAELKQAAAGRWPEILASLGGAPASSLDGKHHACPLCGGKDRFRLIDAAAGACLCNRCFDRKNGDGLAALRWLRNWTLNEAADAVAGFLGATYNGKGRGKGKGKGGQDEQHKANPLYLSPRHAIQAALTQLGVKGGPASFATAWRYGPFSVVRFNLSTPAGQKQKKTFKPIHPETLADGREAWRFGYPPDLKIRPLYRLAELQQVADTRLLTIHGGEKAADAAAALGLTATTNAGGEKAAALTDWAPAARFTEIAVVIDNDPAGEAFHVAVAERIKAATGKDTKKIVLPDLPPAGDIVEWVAAGGTLPAFREIVGSAIAAPPDRYAVARKICEAVEVDVLGELPDRTVKAFSFHHGKAVEIARPSFITYQDALQMFGPPVLDKVLRPGEEPRPGRISVDDLKNAIGLIGGSEQAGAGAECGLGVWRGQPDEEGGPPPLVLVSAGSASVWDGTSLRVVRRPRVAGLKVDLGAPAEEKWFCHRTLAEYLEAAGDKAWAESVISQVGNLFAKWAWRSATDAVCDLVTALVACSFVQTLWGWRPFVSIIGSSDAGKTSLFELLESLLGPLALLNSKSTEAGIRQTVGHHAKVILCDEFENDRHRQAIMELFRTSSKGAKTLRGTSGKQEGRHFGLRHIPWVTAVEIQFSRAPDRNRFIALELDQLPPESRGKLDLPPELELGDLGQRLLALAVRHATAANRLATRLKGRSFPGVHGRVVESFSTPCGFLAAIGGMTEDQAAGLMGLMFEKLEQDPEQGTKDETDLMATILGSHVDLGRGEKATVGQILASPTDAGWDALDRVGVAPVADRPGTDARTESYRTGLFIAHREVSRYLLARTKWEGQGIDQMLRRLPGAVKSRQRTAGHLPYGVLVPWRLIKERYLAERPDEF